MVRPTAIACFIGKNIDRHGNFYKRQSCLDMNIEIILGICKGICAKKGGFGVRLGDESI
jgi:hypothetical protein